MGRKSRQPGDHPVHKVRTALMSDHFTRRYPIGAELIGKDQTHFRVWAPNAKTLDLVLEESAEENARRSFVPLQAEAGGYFSGAADAKAGSLYRFRVNGDERFHPDPASRSQPQGPHRSSCVIDPSVFNWTDQHWNGLTLPGQIIYEMHVGTFTQEGTWRDGSWADFDPVSKPRWLLAPET